MIAAAASNLGQSRDMLRDLLHFVSQPLTTLHGALESSLAQDQMKCAVDVLVALEQTDRVIEALRLMRVPNVLRQVKAAIAQRTLESAGASVEIYSDGNPGFTIHIPQSASALSQLSA